MTKQPKKKRNLDIIEMSCIAQKWMCLVCVTRRHAEIYLSRQLEILEKWCKFLVFCNWNLNCMWKFKIILFTLWYPAFQSEYCTQFPMCLSFISHCTCCEFICTVLRIQMFSYLLDSVMRICSAIKFVCAMRMHHNGLQHRKTHLNKGQTSRNIELKRELEAISKSLTKENDTKERFIHAKEFHSTWLDF